jgi:UDPglucose 6-dehydrogenase
MEPNRLVKNRSSEVTPVGIVGLGYVGLSTAACFLSRGIPIVGVDVDAERVTLLSKGVVPIQEVGVEPMIKGGLSSGMVSFHRGYEAMGSCGTIFLTVGTPSLRSGAINMSYITAAAHAVGKLLAKMKGYPIVVVKSTVIPGTTRKIVLPILEKESELRCGKNFGLVTNPEFVREGKALWDMMNPDAIVIGRVDSRSVRVMKTFYRRVYDRLPPLLVTEAVNSEFVKYSVNSFRALQLSFINELASMSSLLEGARVEEVIKGLMMVAKIDPRYSRAGLGFGGSCLPKDTNALVAFARSLGVNADLLAEAIRSNERQASHALDMVKDLVGPLKGRRIALLGLTFKADTDDTRESVGPRIAKALSRAGASVVAYDPGYRPPPNGSADFELAKSAVECLQDADCCIVTNEWKEFRELRPSDFKKFMRLPAVVDGRGLFDVERFEKERVMLRRIGAGPSPQRARDRAAGTES